MSALPLKADMLTGGIDVRFLPQADGALCFLAKRLLAIKTEQEQVICNFEPSREN